MDIGKSCGWSVNGIAQSPNCRTRPLGGAVGPLWGGGARVCMMDLLIFNEIWTQGKIYFIIYFACLKYFTYQLVPVLASNCKQ
jgi:hypothetical protein